MAMRSVANLNINLGLFGFPVKVYKATNEPTEGIGFTQVHAECGNSINQIKRCHHCEKDVQMADIKKGYKHDGKFLLFTDDEIKALRPEAAGNIKIDGYLAADEIDAAYLEGSVNYLSPDRGDKKKGPQDTFVTFREALGDRWAIGKVVMYGREHAIAIRAVEKVLAMHFIRTTAEIRSMDDIPGYDEVPETPNREYVDLMGQIIEKQTVNFHEVVIESDAYVASVKALIDSRINGEPAPAQAEHVAAPAAVDLMAMLKASLAASK